ncbi:MAG: L,D-transpeptidase family protein [Solirubrobacteraceae bacterium]
MRRLLPVLILAFAAVPAQAQTTTPEPPPAPAPAPAPVKAKMKLDLQKVGTVERAVTFTGKAFRVSGTVTPYVAGQEVRVRVYRGKQLVSAKTKKIKPSNSGTVGLFRAEFRTKVPGRLRAGVTHVRTAEMAYAHGATSNINVISPGASPGATGFTVKVMQGLLRDNGYVPGHFGVYDARTARAVLAFRKMSGLARITTASRTVLRRMINGGGQFEVQYPSHGHHVEGDLTHQVLALINGNKVERLYHMSSGKPSTPTVLGHFAVYSKTPGTNSHGMIDSSYFIGGYAVHGYESVPTYPASHGCLRVPPEDAYAIYSWIGLGDKVDVYYRSGHHKKPKPSPNAGP